MPLRREKLEPLIPWETLRDAYSARFGALSAVHEVYDWFHEASRLEDSLDDSAPSAAEDEGAGRESFLCELIEQIVRRNEEEEALEMPSEPVAYYALWFRSHGEAGPRFVTATFGAAPYTGGVELFLSSEIMLSNFDILLADLVEDHAPLAPNTIVPIRVRPFPFTAVLLLPVGERSFSLGRVGGVERYALQVVPLTASERALGEDSVESLVRSLSRAGVLAATDPLRDCVLCPERTRYFWAHQRPGVLSRAKRKIDAWRSLKDRLAAAGASEARLVVEEQAILSAEGLVRHIESREIDPDSEAERMAAKVRALRETLERLYVEIEPTMRVIPEALRETCQEVLGLGLGTHPLADALFREIIGGVEPPDFGTESLLASVLEWFRDNRPELSTSLLLRAGRAGLELAREQAAAADGVLPVHIAWSFAVQNMYFLPEEEWAEGAEARIDIVSKGIETVSDCLAYEALDAPPFDRLVIAVKTTVFQMSGRFHAHVQGGEGALVPKGERERYH
jgi:hypothetical protein